MATDKTRLRSATQAYKLSFNLLSPRNWQLKDVDPNGADEGEAAPDPAVDLGPAHQFLEQPTLVEAFDGIRDLTVSGSVTGGGFTIPLVVPQVAAEFVDYFGVELDLMTWHGNIPGVVGGSGVDPDGIHLCRGYMRRATSRATYEMKQVAFDVRSTTSFWQDSSFSRGIDYHIDMPHGPPDSPAGIIGHLVDYHSNSSPRSILGIYLPGHHLGTSFSVNQGSLYDMVKQLANNACLIGWVYAGRNDNIRVTGHPNLVGAAYHLFYEPIIDYDDSIVLEWEIEDQPDSQVGKCAITIVYSDQTEEVVEGYAGRGLGSRDSFTIRSDDISVANDLNYRYLRHANRRYPRVRAKVPLNVAVDIGDIVTCTTEPKYNNRGIAWDQKRFVVTDLEYQIETGEQRFSSWVTMDEIVTEY